MRFDALVRTQPQEFSNHTCPGFPARLGIDPCHRTPFSDEEVAGGVDRNPGATIESVGNGGNHARSGVDPPDPGVRPTRIKNEEVAGGVQRQNVRVAQPGLGRGTAVVFGRVASFKLASGAGDGADHARSGVDPSHPLVRHVRDKEVAGSVQRHPGGNAQPGLGRGTAVA